MMSTRTDIGPLVIDFLTITTKNTVSLGRHILRTNLLSTGCFGESISFLYDEYRPFAMEVIMISGHPPSVLDFTLEEQKQYVRRYLATTAVFSILGLLTYLLYPLLT